MSPHQVLLDAKLDSFQHDAAGSALSRLPPSSPRTHPRTIAFSDVSYISLLFSVLFVGSVHGLSFGGLSIWRAVFFVSVFFVFMFPWINLSSLPDGLDGLAI